MEIAIIGLSQSGKTTVFNAVTKGKAEVASFGGRSNKPNIGTAKVPDSRFVQLNKIFKPQKTTPAEIRFIDIPSAPEGVGESNGISGEYLNLLQRSDALALIIRAFQNSSVPHPSGKTNPQGDLETMLYELSFSDIEIHALDVEFDSALSFGFNDSEISIEPSSPTLHLEDLSIGVHNLSVRVIDSDGVWSESYSVEFRVNGFPTAVIESVEATVFVVAVWEPGTNPRYTQVSLIGSGNDDIGIASCEWNAEYLDSSLLGEDLPDRNWVVDESCSVEEHDFVAGNYTFS